jgi:hypothetical protein
MKILDGKADEIIRRAASTVFVSTAIWQNGKVDALMALGAQTRMIWEVARVYNQPPSVREVSLLYGNVGATSLVASGIEDLDLSEQLEPVIKAAVGHSLVGLVPGMTSVSSIVTHSVLGGAANAFLTLRVGVICRTYCACVTAFQPSFVRRSAALSAAAMLGSVVSASAGRVVKAILMAAKNAGASTMESAAVGVSKLNPFRPGRDK